MNEILNFIKINELISTSGQPTAQQFGVLKEEGFEVVVNLSSSDSSNVLENQDKLLTELGLTYIHIPVDFEEPKLSDLKLFLNIMQALGANKVLIHCESNYRVTAFIYVLHKYILKTAFEEIDLSMFEEWSPNTNWQTLMKTSFEELQRA